MPGRIPADRPCPLASGRDGMSRSGARRKAQHRRRQAKQELAGQEEATYRRLRYLEKELHARSARTWSGADGSVDVVSDAELDTQKPGTA